MTLEAEKCIVAAGIKSDRAYDIVSQTIQGDEILDPIYRCIWEKLSELREVGATVDIVILAAALNKSSDWLSLNVGLDTRDMLQDIVFSSRSYRDTAAYAKIVHHAAVDRRIYKFSEEVKEVSHSSELDPDQKLGEVHALLNPLTENVPDGFSTYKDSTREAVQQIIELKERGGGLGGLSTGWDAIDEITSGLHDSELIVVGARPSMGKTVFGMGLADHVAQTAPVLVYSMEMPRQMLAKRSLAKFSGINMRDILKGHITDHDGPILQAAGLTISGLNLRIDDSADLTIEQIRTRTRVAARKEKPRLIMLDYLTLIKSKGDNMHMMVGDVTKSLKAMAKEFECPVVCLAQLNRSLEKRPDKRPVKSDLRESGSIEEDADTIIFLYRDEIYNEDSSRQGILEVDIAKQRNGPIGTRYLRSQLEYQRFVELTTAVPEIESKTNVSPLSGFSGRKFAYNDAKGF